MMRKITAMLAAFAFAGATLAPAAEARDHRDGYRHYRHYDGDYYRDRRHGDAVAAGAVGLILGLALGAAASEPRRYGYRDGGCYDRCGPPPPPRCYDRCGPPPPPPCYDRCGGYDDGYYRRGGYDDGYYRRGGYDDGYRGGAYEDDYGYGEPRRMCRVRQWDRYARRYLMVDVPC